MVWINCEVSISCSLVLMGSSMSHSNQDSDQSMENEELRAVEMSNVSSFLSVISVIKCNSLLRSVVW